MGARRIEIECSQNDYACVHTARVHNERRFLSDGATGNAKKKEKTNNIIASIIHIAKLRMNVSERKGK